jgi:ATP-binding cassette, subfamily B, bacterial IrtB/YbtQ
MNRQRITSWSETYRQLMRSTGSYARQLRVSLVGLAIGAIAQGLALACLFPLFDAVLNRQDRTVALRWLIATTILMTVATAVRWRAQSFEYSGRLAAATHELRTRLGEQLRRVPLEYLQEKRAGEINSTLLGNVDENLYYALAIINIIVLALLTPLVTALATLLVDWRLGLVLLLVFPAIIPLYRWRRPVFSRGMRLLAEAHQRTNAEIVEYVQGLPVLRAARCEGKKASALQASFTELETIQTTGHRNSSRPNVVIASVVEIGLLLVLAVGVSRVVHGSLDVAVLATMCVLIVRFAEPLATFVSYTAILDMIEAALERIEALLAVKPLPQVAPAREPARFDVRFDHVSFQYARAAEPAICNVSIELAARSMTALVGPSGSGKTTLTRLLLRHTDPQAGVVSIGGVDVREIPTETLNTLISVVFQDVYLFDDTVLANIRIARPDASDQQVEGAARSAQCLDFIERLPQRWHTRLGDIGGRLSGGERQRLSIARALLKNAPIVILDEPTAALDTQSELAVQRAIDALIADKTVIVIAHRLSTIAGADRIVVLDEGRVVAQGRHDMLLASGGRYASMWAAQQRTKAWRVGSP